MKNLMWILVLASMVLASCGNGGPLTPMAAVAPPPTETLAPEQIALTQAVVATASHEAMCSARAGQGIVQTPGEFPEMLIPGLTYEVEGQTSGKYLKFVVSVGTIYDDCGASGSEVRVVPSNVGNTFYPDKTLDQIWAETQIKFLTESGEVQLLMQPHNNGVITLISNFTPDQIKELRVWPKLAEDSVTITRQSTSSDSAQWEVVIEDQPFWPLPATSTPAPCQVVYSQGTPLPPCPTPTMWGSPWLDFLLDNGTPTPTPPAP